LAEGKLKPRRKARKKRGLKSASLKKKKEKKKKKRHPQNHSLKRKWGNYTNEEVSNSCVNTGCLPQDSEEQGFPKIRMAFHSIFTYAGFYVLPLEHLCIYLI